MNAFWDASVKEMMQVIVKNPKHLNILLETTPPGSYVNWTSRIREAASYVSTHCGHKHSGASFVCCLRESVRRLKRQECTRRVAELKEELIRVYWQREEERAKILWHPKGARMTRLFEDDSAY